MTLPNNFCQKTVSIIPADCLTLTLTIIPADCLTLTLTLGTSPGHKAQTKIAPSTSHHEVNRGVTSLAGNTFPLHASSILVSQARHETTLCPNLSFPLPVYQ